MDIESIFKSNYELIQKHLKKSAAPCPTKGVKLCLMTTFKTVCDQKNEEIMYITTDSVARSILHPFNSWHEVRVCHITKTANVIGYKVSRSAGALVDIDNKLKANSTLYALLKLYL